MKKPRQSPDTIKLFYEAIGEMCTEWAHLEQWINRLFLAVGNWDYRDRLALVMSARIAQRDQIAAIKAGVIERCAPGEFLTLILGSLNYVDNQLRTERNRYVHDILVAHDDGIGGVRVDRTQRIKKDLESGEQFVQQWENRYLTIEYVRRVITDVISERDHLEEIVGCFQNPQDGERAMRLSAPLKRLHLLRQKERQSQMDKARAKPRRKPFAP
jgi:hypothetical protein